MLTYDAFAKINLTLDVGARREDGYHEIASVVHAVSLKDKITLCLTETGRIEISCDKPGVPLDESNIAAKAARAFYRETGIPFKGLSVSIAKSIPAQAGLGGGSADGAAVIVGLCDLHGIKIPAERLCEIGAMVGADIPCCIRGGALLMTGFGEQLEPLEPLGRLPVLIAQPNRGISTREAYDALDRAPSLCHPDSEGAAECMRRRDAQGVLSRVQNIFEQVTDIPEIEEIKRVFLRNGALAAAMTGSGSAVFGIFDVERGCGRAPEELLSELGLGCIAAELIPHGCKPEQGAKN